MYRVTVDPHCGIRSVLGGWHGSCGRVSGIGCSGYFLGPGVSVAASVVKMIEQRTSPLTKAFYADPCQ